MSQPPPADPFTSMSMGMAQLHELYIGFIEGGFSSAEAMELTKTMVIDSLHQGAARAMPCPHCGKLP